LYAPQSRIHRLTVASSRSDLPTFLTVDERVKSIGTAALDIAASIPRRWILPKRTIEKLLMLLSFNV
jgi:hypothetical protein